MTFIDNEVFKSTMIAELKSRPAITNLFSSPLAIREVQWQGDEFGYPNVRLRVISNEPIGTTGCYHTVQVGVQVYSEEKSSKEVEHISGIIAKDLHENNCFTQGGITLILRLTNIVPALRVDERTWMSEILLTAIAS
jgi:hypothetical protein